MELKNNISFKVFGVFHLLELFVSNLDCLKVFMGVSDQRDRIFSFLLGRLGGVCLFCLRVLNLFILVEMVSLDSLQALLFRHRFLIEIPLVLGGRVRSTAHFELP